MDVLDDVVLLRPITPADRELLRRALPHLSRQTLYQRFHAAKSSFTQQELRYLTEVDGVRHAALVAVNRHTGALVGVARYVTVAPGEAEAAIIVADAYQARGYGRQMLLALEQLALRNGVTVFIAEVQSGNKAMLGLLHRYFEVMDTVSNGPTVTCRVHLQQDRAALVHSCSPSRAAMSAR